MNLFLELRNTLVHAGKQMYKHASFTQTYLLPNQVDHPPFMENETRRQCGEPHTHKEGILILLFYHAGKERGKRHHGYDPPGAE